MTSPRFVLAAARLLAVGTILALITAFGLIGSTAPAQAATYSSQVLAEAAHHQGQPYVYGAAGPTRFDCSGFTKYVFSRFGRNLPHSSSAQYNAVRHITRSQLAPGDLIFFRNSSGSITHVGIYAGHGNMWHAPHSGTVVKLAAIYSSHYSVGRI